MSRTSKIMLLILLELISTLIIAAVAGAIFLRMSEDSGLARLDVYTEGGAKITSKEEYVDCTVSLSETDEEYIITDASAGIRGRGNSTWNWPKKPYRIKFESKTSLFGGAKNKSWVLLATYMDFSLIKDKLAFNIADALGTDAFVPTANYVELYLNGKYQGIYLLTDQVDENKGRTGVKSDFTAEDTEVPFLVELDAYAPDEGVEGVDWFTVHGRPYAIKYPEADERYTDAQFDYIVNYVKKVDELCRKSGVTLAELSEYIDLDAFVDYYIVKEFMGDPELNYKSVYMSKTKDGKLKMGPVWDFDWSCIGPNTMIMNDPSYLEDEYDTLRSSDNWFAALYGGSPEFRRLLAQRWSEARSIIISELDAMRASKDSLTLPALRDKIRWFYVRPRAGYSSYFDRVMVWCDRRVDFLDGAFAYGG